MIVFLTGVVFLFLGILPLNLPIPNLAIFLAGIYVLAFFGIIYVHEEKFDNEGNIILGIIISAVIISLLIFFGVVKIPNVGVNINVGSTNST